MDARKRQPIGVELVKRGIVKEKDIENIEGNIITTEKDAVRLANNPHFPPDIMPYIFYLPITVEFTNDGDMPPFIEALVNSIESNK